MNRVCLVGRLVADPELAYTSNAIAVAKGRIAVRDPFRKREDGSYETDFFDWKAWQKTAEYLANNTAKGDLVEISDRLTVEEWNGQDGTKRTRVLVPAELVQKLVSAQPREEGNGYRQAPASSRRPDEKAPAYAAAAPAGDEASFNDPFADP